jgi:hypothetical protein
MEFEGPLLSVDYTTDLLCGTTWAMNWRFPRSRKSFGLCVHPLSHTGDIGHVSYSLQFICYKTTYNIWTSTPFNVINNNIKFMETNWLWNLPLHLDICALYVHQLCVRCMFKLEMTFTGVAVDLFSSRCGTFTVHHHMSVSWRIRFNGARLGSVVGTWRSKGFSGGNSLCEFALRPKKISVAV